MDRVGELVNWEPAILIHDQLHYTAAGPDARQIDPGRFGSEYPRTTRQVSGGWFTVYTIYDNGSYLADPAGGTKLEIAVSRDNARTWQTNREAPWDSWWVAENIWSSVYATGDR